MRKAAILALFFFVGISFSFAQELIRITGTVTDQNHETMPGVSVVHKGTSTGSGNYVSIDFRRDAATLTAGVYNIVPDATAQVGDAIAGYPALFGSGNWGSVWGSVSDGTGSDVKITGGTVTVSVSDDIYTIEIEATTEDGDIKATYTGNLE